MDFPVDEKLPEAYFTDIINAQIMMIKIFLADLDTSIVFSSYCASGTASFRFYMNTTDDASPILNYTFSNLGDLKDHLYQFWLQLIYLMKGT